MSKITLMFSNGTTKNIPRENITFQENGNTYKVYLLTMSEGKYLPDLEAVAKEIIEKDKQEAQQYLNETDWVEMYLLRDELGIEEIDILSNKLIIKQKRIDAKKVLNGS